LKREIASEEIQKVQTTCTDCGVGCQFDLVVKDENISVSERSIAQSKSGPNGNRPSTTGSAFRSGTARIIGVESNPEAPVNGMALCVKGRYGWEFIHNEERVTKPRVRRYLLEGGSKPKGQLASGQNPLWDWVETSWEQALDITAERLSAIRREKGADSFGMLTSAKCTNEENYLMNKFARQVVGTNSIDHCARL
jgi:formate dehydrogenase major subunit/formate dehydrogenase alpha subunit